jgi:hypothetical protein
VRIASFRMAAYASKAFTTLRLGYFGQWANPLQWAPAALRNEVDGEKTEKIKLLHSAPVAWVYMTGWASPDGATYFRRDIYSLDKGTKLPVRASGRGSSS